MQQFLRLLSVKHFPNHHVPVKAKAIYNVTWQLHIALFGRAGSLGMTWNLVRRWTPLDFVGRDRSGHTPEPSKHEQRSASWKRYNCRPGREGQDWRRWSSETNICSCYKWRVSINSFLTSLACMRLRLIMVRHGSLDYWINSTLTLAYKQWFEIQFSVAGNFLMVIFGGWIFLQTKRY